MIGKTSENVINGIRFIAITGGCLKIHPDGTRQFIGKDWYEGVDFGPGDMGFVMDGLVFKIYYDVRTNRATIYLEYDTRPTNTTLQRTH